jgi:uncharacterized membrane protein YeaQ/YmgE (transglycosylase-associated protein family)
MWIVWAALIGLIVGAIARMIVPGDHPRGVLVTIVIGVVGAEIATLFGHAVGWHGSAGFFGSIIGAVVLLLVLQALSGRSRTQPRRG